MKIIIIAVGLITALTAGAQDSLYHYLMIASKNNPVVLQKFFEYEAAWQKIPQVGSLPDPELSMGVFLSPMELVGGNQVADLRLMQMFPWFGTLRNARDEMSMMANAKFEIFRDAKLQLYYEIQKTWYALYKVQQDILISEKNIGILRSLERLSLTKFKTASAGGSSSTTSDAPMPAGVLPANDNMAPGSATMAEKSGAGAQRSSGQVSSGMPGNSMGTAPGTSGLADLYRIQMEIGELENNIALLRAELNTMTALFNNYLNRPVQMPVSLPDTLIADTLYLSLQAVEDSMFSGNPMLEMLQYEQQSFEYRTKMVTKMGYPMIGLGLNYSVISKNEMSASEMNGKDMIMPMVSVTLPIYRKRYKSMRLETDLLRKASDQSYSAAVNNLKTEYYQAIQLYEDARRRVRLYENQRLLATKSLGIMLESFAGSGSGLTEVLRIRQQTLEFEKMQVEALADYHTALAWLNKLGNLEINEMDITNQ